jgi:hypothetical protein
MLTFCVLEMEGSTQTRPAIGEATHLTGRGRTANYMDDPPA